MARERVERGNEASAEQPRMSLSVAELRQLISLMNGSDIDEIAIEQEASGLKLTLRKPAPVAVGGGSTNALFDGDDGYDGAEGSDSAASSQPEDTSQQVRASLVGLFRANMKPGAKPLVGLGDVVRVGQVVGALEALNVLNEVEATTAGRISAIFVEDGQPVEYGQPLLAIEPHSR